MKHLTSAQKKQNRANSIKRFAIAECKETISKEAFALWTEDEKIAQGMASLITTMFDFDSRMFNVFALACEDANFHDECREIREIEKKLNGEPAAYHDEIATPDEICESEIHWEEMAKTDINKHFEIKH
jgi:hypothetical protein